VGFVALTDAAARRIYFHTAGVGRTRGTVESNRRACFSAAEMG